MAFKFLMVGAILAVSAAPASATSIAVANASFETLPAGGLTFSACGAGCSYSDDAIPGWTYGGVAGVSGQFQPGPASNNFNYFNYIPNGLTVAYSNASGGTISQTVAASAVAGTTYTLQVDLGFRKDVGDPGSVTLVVGANSVLATGLGAQLSGNWYTYTASYTALAGDAGAPISIVLYTGASQGDFDNVVLSATGGVPEPDSWALLIAGFGLTGFAMRRSQTVTTA